MQCLFYFCLFSHIAEVQIIDKTSTRSIFVRILMLSLLLYCDKLNLTNISAFFEIICISPIHVHTPQSLQDIWHLYIVVVSSFYMHLSIILSHLHSEYDFNIRLTWWHFDKTSKIRITYQHFTQIRCHEYRAGS